MLYYGLTAVDFPHIFQDYISGSPFPNNRQQIDPEIRK